MVDKDEFEFGSSPLLRKILALLAELNKSRQGKVFYKHIKQTLEDWEATQTKTIDTYEGLLNLLLDVFASRLPPESIALTHIKLIQACLTPPHTDAELSLLKDSVEQAADILRHSCHIDAEEVDDTLTPLLQRMMEPTTGQPFPKPTPKEAKKGRDHFHLHDEYGPVEESAEFAAETTGPAAEKSKSSLEYGSLSGDEQLALDDYDRIVDGTDEPEQYAPQDHEASRDTNKPLKAPRAVLRMLRFPEREQTEIFEQPPTAQSEDMSTAVPSMEEDTESGFDFDDTYPVLTEMEGEAQPPDDESLVSAQDETTAGETDQQQEQFAERTREEYEMERLHQDFVKQMRSIMAENEEFGVHLGLEIDALGEDTRVNNVEDRRRAILGSLKKLSDSHAQLAKKFDTAQTYLSIIESDKQKLSDELARARKLSLTDDLTALPNRRAFMRRMDDEVSRVKRYGFPLSLVLIDIDYFKQVNDEYGHNAGDAVLRVYAEQILSVFRHHDMIARYGGEEFAVLLPNTDLEGVLRALDKVKSTVPNVTCSLSDATIAAPTFSAGVAEYRIPETPTQFIERADHALYRAKRLGRNRIEVEHADHEHGLIDHT